MATPESLLQNIEDALSPLVAGIKGKLDVAEDLDRAMSRLANAPKHWRMILLWNGYGDHDQARNGMNSHLFTVIIHQNLGMSRVVGKPVHRAGHGNDTQSFMDLLKQVSGWMRALRWPNGHNVVCEGMALNDSQWVSDVPKVSRAHALNFSLDAALEDLPDLIVIPAP